MRPEFAHLVDKLDELSRQKAEAIASGAAKDFAEYRYLVGTINGLKQAAQEIETYGKAYDDD